MDPLRASVLISKGRVFGQGPGAACGRPGGGRKVAIGAHWVLRVRSPGQRLGWGGWIWGWCLQTSLAAVEIRRACCQDPGGPPGHNHRQGRPLSRLHRGTCPQRPSLSAGQLHPHQQAARFLLVSHSSSRSANQHRLRPQCLQSPRRSLLAPAPPGLPTAGLLGGGSPLSLGGRTSSLWMQHAHASLLQTK